MSRARDRRDGIADIAVIRRRDGVADVATADYVGIDATVVLGPMQ
jgi:hypothetical protein